MVHENKKMQETPVETSEELDDMYEIPIEYDEVLFDDDDENKYEISIEYDEVMIHYDVKDAKQGPDPVSMLIHTISSIEVGGRVLSHEEVENLIERSEEESMWAEQDEEYDSPFYPLYESVPYDCDKFKDVEYIRNQACISFVIYDDEFDLNKLYLRTSIIQFYNEQTKSGFTETGYAQEIIYKKQSYSSLDDYWTLCELERHSLYDQTLEKKEPEVLSFETNESENAVTTATSVEVGQLSKSGTAGGHDYVDLGLSVKWATCNLGAVSPEECGDYYAWGETSAKTEYIEGNSKSVGVSLEDISGNSDYDAATHLWGEGWRMPTKAEIEELVENTMPQWTTLEGVQGYLVTSNKNGNSIFLPAAGYRFETSLYMVGQIGNYWGATTDVDKTDGAYNLDFGENEFDIDWSSRRNIGFGIRPVRD